ncbi:hypothetical protein Zmor_023590 [Zophobas morio]|uniref:Uncharacterized protein n=1 Tax=Zophobas morio TaxID=2755281 RepID=A0AA38HYD0_9CUCU|nr:hypothetical protein Zmor_023590 [Zophobas morio]
MYKIILAQLDWILPLTDWIVPEGGLYLNAHNFSRYSAIEVFLEYPSRLPLPGPAAVTNDESPIISVHTSKPSGKLTSVVPERPVGLFRNNMYLYLPLELY